MSILETLIDRTSTPPRLMEDTDGPTPSDIQDILRAAMSAPDHGSVRPWRFVIVEGDDRATLGRVFADALKTRDPGASEEAIAKEMNRPLRAPVVIAILARVVHDRPNVPEIEQIVATACAAQNMLLAANAKGFGGILLTGKNARDKNVRSFFGLKPGDELVSFLYLGKSKSDQPAKPRPDPAQFIEKFGAMRT
jgi:nitroreductase